MFIIPTILFMINSAWPVPPRIFPDDPQEATDYPLHEAIGQYGFTSGFI